MIEPGVRLLESLADGPQAAIDALAGMRSADALRRALSGCVAAVRGSPDLQEVFHSVWTTRGHRIREVLEDDGYLAEALLALLPRYRGSRCTLYRGKSAERFERGRIGFCWTGLRDTAEMFARGLNAVRPPGGFLLQVSAAPSAIIAGPSAHSRYLGEDEHTVDPRALRQVLVLDRFPPLTW